MLRRALLTLVLTAASAAGGMLGAAPAHAVGGCELRVPARITIKQSRTVLRGPVTGGCRRADGFAAWELSKDGGDPGRVTDVYYDEPSDGASATLDLQATTVQWGRNVLSPLGAGGSCSEATGYEDCSLPQNAPTTDIRLASGSGLSARRVGRTITLTGTTAVFSPAAGRLVRRTARGQFQWRTRGHAWHRLRAVTTGRTGTATARVRATRHRNYRFVTSATGSWWTSVSASVTR